MRQPPGWSLGLVGAIDAVSRVAGLVAIWLTLLSAMVSAANALLRYTSAPLLSLYQQTGFAPFHFVYDFYAQSSNSLTDSVWYMFAAIVMFGGAFTLRENAHVRVDLVYGFVSERTRTWIDLLGGLIFLLPLSVLLIWLTLPWAWESAVRLEGSASAGGLPLWPAKMLLPLGFALVGLQGFAEIVKCLLALTTSYVREHAYEKPLQ